VNFWTNTGVNLSKDYSAYGHLTWLPSLVCPSGTYPFDYEQSAYAETIVRLPNGEVNYIETGEIVFDNALDVLQ
jgi:hypothetical protein